MKSILTGHQPSKHMVCRAPGRFVYPSSHSPYFLRNWKIYPTSKYRHHQHHHHHVFLRIGKSIQLLNIILINILITIFSLDLESTSNFQSSSSTVSPLECTEADWVYRQNATSVKYFKRRKLQKGTIYQYFILYIIISFPDFKWSALVLVAVIMIMIILMMMMKAIQGGWVLAEMRSAVCEIFKRRDIAKPTRDPLIRK